MNKLLSSNIALLNKIYQEKASSPSEIVKACYNRIEKTKKLNAYITLTKETAENQAKECDKRLAANKRLSPLDGVPIALKDNFCTENIPTTCASKMLKNFLPPYNATVYKRLQEKGVVLIGKTNLDEFAMGSGTVDSVFGPTKNVYNAKTETDFHIAGGSSGGSAVAVATGSCFAALGSDTGGSVRNPAAFCGIVGFKPTYGLISRHGLIPLVHSMDCPGVFARSISDCVMVFNAIAGPDDKDSTTRKRKFNQVHLPAKPNVKGLRIGIPKEYHCAHLDENVEETWKFTADLLKNSGADVVEVSLPTTKYLTMCYSVLNTCEVTSNMACYDGIEYGYRAPDCEESTTKLYSRSRNNGFSEVVKSRIMAGNFFLLNENYDRYFLKALKVRRLISNDFDEIFKNVHVLLTPTTVSTAPKYKDFISLNNQEQCVAQDYCTLAANLVGIPAISLPIKLSKDNLPVSVQLMGPNFSERVLFSVGRFIENNVHFPKLSIDL